MRAVVFADSHGDIRGCRSAIERLLKVDMIIHLGDIYRDVLELRKLYPDIPVEYVIGNNDPGAPGEYTKVIELEGHKILITHGHYFRSTWLLADRAKKEGACMALFGHTHCRYRETIEGVDVINFGSISRPRDGAYSCGVIEVENGKIAAMTLDY